jgi:hypothetical protein
MPLSSTRPIIGLIWIQRQAGQIGCEDRLHLAGNVDCAALAARVAVVRIGSTWTIALDRSSLDSMARW